MRRTVIAAFAAIMTTFAIAPAFAEDTPLRTPNEVKQFWQDHAPQSGGGQ